MLKHKLNKRQIGISSDDNSGDKWLWLGYVETRYEQSKPIKMDKVIDNGNENSYNTNY